MIKMFALWLQVAFLVSPAMAMEVETPLLPKGKESNDGFELPQITPGPAMTLSQALLAADKRNLGLAAARQEIEKASAMLTQAWSAVLPIANAGMEYLQHDHEDSFVLDPVLAPDEIVFMRPQNLKGTFDMGISIVNAQSWVNIHLAKKGVTAARMSVEQGRQQLLLGVARAYFTALMAGSLIDLYKTQVTSTSHHLSVATARFDAGEGLRIDVVRAETDLAEARLRLLSAHLAFDNARDAMGALTGADGLPRPTKTQPITVPQGTEADLIGKAIRDRPDIKAETAKIEMAQTQLDSVWMQFLPTVEAGWRLEYQFTKPGELGSPDRSRWTALLSMSLPIYNHFRYGDLDHKKAALRQSRLQQQDSERNASVAVRKARRDYFTALSSVAIAERQEILANEALTLTKVSYDAGAGSSLELTDARRRFSEATINLATKRLEAQMSLLDLLSAIGQDMMSLAKRD
ncbi:MAG: TolC family protein [Myxococcota bacterium]|nr:TolC family protein [Myxococcota bacterium]